MLLRMVRNKRYYWVRLKNDDHMTHMTHKPVRPPSWRRVLHPIGPPVFTDAFNIGFHDPHDPHAPLTARAFARAK